MDFYQIKKWPDQKANLGKAYSNERDAVVALLNEWAYGKGSLYQDIVSVSLNMVEKENIPKFPIGMILESRLDIPSYTKKIYRLYSDDVGVNATNTMDPKVALDIVNTDSRISNWFTPEELHTLQNSKVNFDILEYFCAFDKVQALPYIYIRKEDSNPMLMSWYPIHESMSLQQIKDGMVPHQKRMLELYKKIRDKKIKNNPYVADYGPGWEKRTRTIIGCKIPCNKHDITSWDGYTPIKIWVVDPEEVYNLGQDSNGKSKEVSTMHTINFETIVDKDFPFSQITYDHNGYPIVHFFYLESVNFNLDFFSKDQQYSMALEKFNRYNNGTSNKWRNLI